MTSVHPSQEPNPSNPENFKDTAMPKSQNNSNIPIPETSANTTPEIKAVESIFERALKAKNEDQNTSTRIVKAPSRIRPAQKIKGWYCTHPASPFGPIDVFAPKDEGGMPDDAIFILPDLANELRMESTAFENAIREVNCYLVATKGGALILFLAPLPDPTTGRYHSAVEQKIDAVESARSQWKRLEWSKGDLQYEDYTAIGEFVEPKWPEDVSPASILNRTFGERNVIKHRDDPILVKFRGEA